MAVLLVRQHRPAIARVATALLWRGSLTAAEAADVAAVPFAAGWVTAVIYA